MRGYSKKFLSLMHRTQVMPSAVSRRCISFLIDIKMKKLALLWFVGGTVAHAVPAPTTCLDNVGRRMQVLMTTTANANGVPLAAAYRNAADSGSRRRWCSGFVALTLSARRTRATTLRS